MSRRGLAAWIAFIGWALHGAAHAADPQISSFIDDPDPALAGGLYTYTLRVDNNAAEAGLNTHLIVTVPAGAVFVAAAPVAANCSLLSATAVDCALGTVAGLGLDIREVVLTWRALGPGPATIAATATLTANNDTNTANNTQSALTTVVSGANLRLSKSGTPNPVVGGGLITYTLSAANAGPNDAGAIVITDNLPPSVTFVSASGNGWGCTQVGGVVTCTRAGPQPVGANIPPVTVIGRVTAAGGTITNSASVAPAPQGGVADPDSSDNTATVDTQVIAGADIRIAQKTVTSSLPAVAGSNVNFVIAPRNGGPATATDVVVRDSLPPGWTYVSAGGPNWSCNFANGRVGCTRPTMPPGTLDDITVVARAPDNSAIGATGATFTNTATIAAGSADPDASNNSGSVTFTVLRDGADLRLSKSKTPNPVAQGFNMTSTIVVTNNGPQTAVGPLRVVELLDGESYVAPFPGGGWTCDASVPALLVCTHPNAGGLAVGASLPTLSIVTRADTRGATNNTACTGSSVPSGANPGLASPPSAGDPNNTNDCATATSRSTTVQPDLRITKQTTTPVGGDDRLTTSEGSVTYLLTVTNISAAAQDASRAVITDDIPAFVAGSTTYGAISATPSGVSSAVFACSTADARVTCTQTAGLLRRGESVVVSITVNRPLFEGTYNNTASVTNLAEGDPDPSNNQATSQVTIDPIADVEMTGKSVTPNPLRAGEIATYVLSFRNNGPSPAQAVQVSDTFTFPAGDTGLTVVQIDSSAAGSTCNVAAGAVLNPAQASFNCSIGALARGETQTVTLRVRPNFQPPNAARTFTNVARVHTSTVENPAGGDNGNNVQSANLSVTPSAIDLLVNKTDRVGALNLDPVPYAGSAFLSYQVAVTNNGPSYATGAKITENMTPPASRRVRFVCDVTSFGGSNCNAPSLCSPGSIGSTSAPGVALSPFTCSVPAGSLATGAAAGELAVGATKNIWLRFEALDQPAPRGDVYNNVATISANEPDTQAANDSAAEQTTTRQRISLSTVKTSSNGNPNLMEPFNWQVVVTNAGPGNSLRTDLTDTLPAEAEVTGPITWTRTQPAGTGTCTLTGPSVLCALGQIDAGGSATVIIPSRIARYPASGNVFNTATVDTDPDKTGGLDTPGGNNTGTLNLPVRRSSLAGVVFDDRDRAGPNGGTPQVPGTDPRIAGVSFTLSGTDAYGNALTRSATSDAGGNYLFTDLPPSGAGGYTITETQPFGYANGPVDPPTAGPDAPSVAGSTYAAGGTLGNSSYAGVVLGSNVNGVRFNFPEQRRATLAGYVYIDANASGRREAGVDFAIPNATVRLYNAASGVLLSTTTTGDDGAYVFVNLDPAIPYTVEEPLPSTPTGLVNGSTNAGLIGGGACAAGCQVLANAPQPSVDRIANIDLQAGFDGTGFNFGEVLTTHIGGLVWVDTNRDAVLDAAEVTRLAGVTLKLVRGADCATGTVLASTTTGADGRYGFDGVVAYLDYWVCETQPLGYGVGSADGSAGSNAIRIGALPPAGSNNNNFGETLGSLSGSVYLDTGPAAGQYDNGRRDAGEAGLAGVPVSLSGNDISGTAVRLNAVTDANGNYRFTGLLQSDAAGYTVTEGAIPSALGSYADGRDTPGSAGGRAAVNDSISGVVLGAGADATDYLFGELISGSITGAVYIDRDRSGVLDGADTRLPGVTIRLVQGADCASGTPLQTTITDGSGNFAFNNLAAGAAYLLCELQPVGLGSGSDTPGNGASAPATNTIRIGSLPAVGSGGNNFGEVTASLAGSVYADYSAGSIANSDNGSRDSGEVGIPGVTITLSGRDIGGTAVNRSAVTDGNGNFRFDELLQSDTAGYSLSEGAIPPAAGNYNDGRDTVGSVGGSNAVNDRLSGIVLPAGTQATGYLFGEFPLAPITGTVYLDTDRNNVLGGGDGRLPGVLISLVLGNTCSGSVVGTTTTDANGNYLFSGASVGQTYTVCEAQPVAYGEGAINPGLNGSSGANNAITILNLPATGSPGNHFGERAAALSGSVWLDLDNDGLRQGGGEVGISGVTLTLTGTDAAGNTVSRSAVTDANGNYRFDDLPGAGAAGYVLTEQAAQPVVGGVTTLNGRTQSGSTGGSATPPSSLPSRISGIALAVAGESTDNRFGELPPVSISGIVFADGNNNGVLDAPVDTGIAGVTLVITGIDDTGAPVTRSTLTAADGSYAVGALRPGTYIVTEPTQPAGTRNGLTLPGSSGGTATPVATTPSAISGIVLATPGAKSSANNFAEIPGNSAIAGRVWIDANDNGLIDGAEIGIAGVTLTLSGTDVGGQVVTRTTQTDANGNYRFDGLTPGSYTVTEPTQPDGTVNGRTVPGSAGGSATAVATTPSAISAITLGAGVASSANNFGEIGLGGISGRIYVDTNNSGTPDTGEVGLAGIGVVLTGTDDTGAAVALTQVTAADGSYSFDRLRPGTYAVTEPTQPSGLVNGITTAGSLGGSATPVATLPSRIGGIAMPQGGRSVDNNFGEVQSSPDVRVGKSLVEAGLTVGAQAHYRITVANTGDVATVGSYTVSDRLPTGLTLAATPSGSGWACSGGAGASSFSCSAGSVIAAGASNPNVISVTVSVVAAAAAASPVHNAVRVEGGGEVDGRGPSTAERDLFNGNPSGLPACRVPIDQNACRVTSVVLQPASLSGTVWLDGGSRSHLLDGGDTRLAGWRVEVVDPATGQIVGTATTGSDGSYQVRGLPPGIPLGVRFRDPDSGVVFGYPVNGETAPGSSGATCETAAAAAAGRASSCVGTGATPWLSVVLAPGQDLPQQSLPVDPGGVVYDSGTRKPVTGSIVSIAPVGTCAGWNPANALVGAGLGGYTINGNQASMTAGSGGYYQFLFGPAAPANCTFGLVVTPPSGYTFTSNAIPPASGVLQPAGGAGASVAVQPQAGAPTAGVGVATSYFLQITAGSGVASVIHNHLPLDPALPGTVSLSKVVDKATAEVGDTLRYTITVNATSGALPRQTTVVDRLPAGFTYVRGSAMLGDARIADPQGGLGPVLAFQLGAMPASRQLVLHYRLRVGVGAQQGDGLNRARGVSCSVPSGCVDAAFNPLAGSVATNEGGARVKVGGGVFTTDACVAGKIFVDCNGNHVQDAEELGIPGVRLVTQDGTTLISDSEGKYSICGLPAKSAVLKVDALTLPRGSRLTTSSNRNLGDAGSLWLDLKNGELHRADFIEGSCSNTVIEQVKARRAQGEIRAPETEKKGGPALRFDSKARGRGASEAPREATDSANQTLPKARSAQPGETGGERGTR